eukprot:CAMPEP_0195294356 /NCGR_PEP_ID=MMETSP0707-20130614/14744_1 /TAXON_ID=33640 /ORGANISM="Asterionellopsis glacialis, Strain CCMP134" /LENGTH=266 /DNA_ID=CAMNT_0040355301 /DNA_START=9 /DNA_END=809 /DNA_ORIENTATION=-
MATADEHKALGNKAFGEKNYDKAIEHYTDAIRADSKNHVFFSNRSASYAGKNDWKAAIEDAKECIRLEPSFIKGYYRLANALIESKDWDGASSVIKQGLQMEPNNTQLQRQLRTVHQLKREETKKKQQKDNPSFKMPMGGGNGGKMDSALTKELQDLQQQYVTAGREYNTVKADITRSVKEYKSDEITKAELEKLDSTDDTKLYRGIGKMFLLSSRENIMETLDTSVKEQKKKETELTKKSEYLERKIKSLQQNMEELVKAPSSAE